MFLIKSIHYRSPGKETQQWLIVAIAGILYRIPLQSAQIAGYPSPRLSLYKNSRATDRLNPDIWLNNNIRRLSPTTCLLSNNICLLSNNICLRLNRDIWPLNNNICLRLNKDICSSLLEG